MPFIAVLVPLAFHFKGVYRFGAGGRGSTTSSCVFIGTVVAVILGIVTTLYFDAYHASPEEQAVGAYQVSRIVWALFLVFNVALTFGSRELVRELLERRWKAGIGLKRILIAGAGELGRVVAEKILQHRELGYQVVGFVDDRAGGDHLGYRGLPLLGTLADAPEIMRQEHIDHLYVALPLDEHVKMLDLIESTSREMVDVKVVPDLVQFLALRARLEDLDGVPIINIHDVPLQGSTPSSSGDRPRAQRRRPRCCWPFRAPSSRSRSSGRRRGRCSTARSAWDSTAGRSGSTSSGR